MPGIGSAAWVEAFDAACASVEVDAGGERFVLQQELTDTGAAWHVVVDGGRLQVRPGRHEAPDLTLSQDSATAAAIQRGGLAAQQAFMEGTLRVRGAVARLPEVASLFARLPAVPSGEDR